jgi:hypothetical protein
MFEGAVTHLEKLMRDAGGVVASYHKDSILLSF